MSFTPHMPSERRDAVMAEAAKFLVARLASSEDAIAVALEIARDGHHVPEARAAALRSIARLMASAATIANSLARMHGTTHDQRVTVERIDGDKFESLSPGETAESRQKLKVHPRAKGGPLKNSTRTRVEPHIWTVHHIED